jgi:hypothetical protein
MAKDEEMGFPVSGTKRNLAFADTVHEGNS